MVQNDVSRSLSHILLIKVIRTSVCFLFSSPFSRMKNNGENSVFLQSVFCDKSYSLRSQGVGSSGSAVHKVYPGTEIKVFDLIECYRDMRSQSEAAEAAAVAQAAAVAGE